ncbi:MAG: 2-amino-4-hydroxy-6-hydroxymethyldihydropteridine diphosphokinase [Planctomycetota bacterium]|nr:2-amino-4-hydroxy-6-hydroxymethyldihydropteridine diphosphokinase [Planctomycetota bacterium]
MKPVRACIAIGSNLGDRHAAVAAAVTALAQLENTRLETASRAIETEPVGPPQPRYLNAAAIVHTRLPARVLLHHLLAIEHSAGRDRAAEQRWGPRTLDLDIIFYGDYVIDEPGLTVPHPRMHERLFVLEPLALIAPELLHPLLGLKVSDLLTRARLL